MGKVVYIYKYNAKRDTKTVAKLVADGLNKEKAALVQLDASHPKFVQLNEVLEYSSPATTVSNAQNQHKHHNRT